MPNEVTSLLNTLNSYITCPICKFTTDIEIILTCGHLICKNCKIKRTKCPVCYSGLSATKPHSPSIKFIKELCTELSNVSSGEINSVESGLNAGNSIIIPNVTEELATKNGSGIIDNKKIKKKLNFGVTEDVEISNGVVKVINTCTNNDNNRKNSNLKKGIVFYKKHCKHKEEQKIYRKILKGFGIVGIDKNIKKVKSKNALNAREKDLDQQLHTIISRLNDHCPNNVNLENSKFKYSLKMINDSDSSDSDQTIRINRKKSMKVDDTKDGFSDIKCDMKRNEFNISKTSNSLKRKVDSGSEEGPSNKTFVKNIEIVDDCIEYNTVSPVNLEKKLGGIVDETEIIQRYLNPSIEEDKKKEIKNTFMLCNLSTLQEISLPKKPFDEEPHSASKNINNNKTCENLSKSKIKNIVSEFMEEVSQCSEENHLESDIMVDMLHNVSNEIFVVGNNLCTTRKNSEINNSAINSSSDVSSFKNQTDNSFPYKQYNSMRHPVTIKTETESNSGNEDVVVVSDSEDDAQVAEKHSISESSPKKTDQTDARLEKDVKFVNFRIVLDDLAPLMFQSAGNSLHNSNERLGDPNVKKSHARNSNATTQKLDLKKKILKKGKMDKHVQKFSASNNSVNMLVNLPKLPSRPKKNGCDKVLNDFEGFTEDDILILTVKLALFKMNGSKYSKNLSSSSLFSLDGKQILIKDVSQEENYPDSPCGRNKIPDLTIKISESEDESSKSFVTSSVQTENDLLTVTPSPSTSKLRPVSHVKLRGFEIENEKFMQNDVLDIRKPLTPNTPLGKESIASSLSENSPVLRTTPVSRRQLSFVSPCFENNFQYRDDEPSTSDLKATTSAPNSSLNDDWQVLHYRMQHTIPNNVEDTLHGEFERPGVSPTRLTFTTCGLNSKETALVTKLAQMTKSCLTKDFTHNTTHLVIGATGRGKLEYYLAIAYRAFIVTMDWVTLCLALNKILPVTGFIPTEDEGPLKCLEPNSLPFAGFHVYSKILPTSSSYPIAEITKTLLSLGGARVLPNLDAFNTLQDGNYPRFFIYNSKSVLTQPILDKCSSLHILPIQFMWVYESIGAFRAIPVMDFLDIGVHSRTLIRDYKIPDQLACSRYPRLEGEFHPQILDERYQRSL